MARFSISLSSFYDDRLLALAKLRGINKATLAGQLLTEAIKQAYREDTPELQAMADALEIDITDIPKVKADDAD